MTAGDRDPSIEAATTEFYERGATDGLPVVSPTEERIERMLEGADRSPETELGTLGTRKGSLTVETVAVNGVMAGCLPVHMPILLAGAEALADPKSNAIQASVSMGSWAYLFLVNGPIREVLDINFGTAAFGPGFRTNQTVARALGLVYKNCARIHPGEKEMSSSAPCSNSVSSPARTRSKVSGTPSTSNVDTTPTRARSPSRTQTATSRRYPARSVPRASSRS